MNSFHVCTKIMVKRYIDMHLLVKTKAGDKTKYKLPCPATPGVFDRGRAWANSATDFNSLLHIIEGAGRQGARGEYRTTETRNSRSVREDTQDILFWISFSGIFVRTMGISGLALICINFYSVRVPSGVGNNGRDWGWKVNSTKGSRRWARLPFCCV